ncbi:ABC transporter substrate-binding protein [Occultella glacieicola]|uniref:ABC transporter substrate-binding protein n=1 Tax=Occultella glacieicola TaxID=2518684 RepID=A0ABY2E2Q5_9MICO|nr:ABC transporter substrate-binding protein [Occultella glacieicola]TDE92509.1 ABC transporter substrate-binding protein [Occultella glacieicola]
MALTVPPVRSLAALTGAAALALALGACGTDEPDGGAPDLPGLTIGLTYVPNVQFAPFYVAEQRGYFDEAGVDVTLRHHGESEDIFGALASGTEDVVTAGGDEILQARSLGTPAVSIATMYQEYPVALIVPEDSDIQSGADLAGRTIGVPGPFGETYFGLLAMLDLAGLTAEDVTIEFIGFTQQSALAEEHVDAVMGFSNNDIPQFRATGLDVRAVPLGPDVPLVGIGLGTTDDVLAAEPEALTAVITAVGRAVADIAAEPQLAVDAAREEIPGTMTAEQEAISLATVEETIPLYGDLGGPWGRQDGGTWEQMAEFMTQTGLITDPVSASQAHTNDLIGAE